jgi:hypothetical protein
MRFTRNIGFVLLAIFLILWGLMTLFGFGSQVLTIILAIIAIVAGIFIFIDR